MMTSFILKGHKADNQQVSPLQWVKQSIYRAFEF